MPTIPSCLHFVWFRIGDKGLSSPPRELQAMIDTWTTTHPTWTYYVWNNESALKFLQTHYPSHVAMYQAYPKEIYRIDAIRYFLLHHYGGFYVDTDCTCHRSLETLRRHKVVLCTNRYVERLATPIHNNHFMGSVARNPFFRDCIDRLLGASVLQTHRDSYLSVMGTAGPFFLSTVATSSRHRREITTLSQTQEASYLTHHEKHSWKLARSIASDVLTGAVVAGGVVAGIYLWRRSKR